MSVESSATGTESEPHASGLLARWRRFEQAMSSVLGPFALLLVRVLIGYAMLRAGWGKFNNLEAVTGFFGQLGIPMPAVNAAIVAGVELVGGGLVMLGLFTRTAAFALTVVMAVALFTAHMEEVTKLFIDPGAVVGAAPVPFLAVMLLLGVTGAGLFSLDRIIGLNRPSK